jgi:hypothetical protein
MITPIQKGENVEYFEDFHKEDINKNAKGWKNGQNKDNE